MRIDYIRGVGGTVTAAQGPEVCKPIGTIQLSIHLFIFPHAYITPHSRFITGTSDASVVIWVKMLQCINTVRRD